MATFFLSLEQFLRRFQRFLPLSRRVQKHKIFGLGFPLLEKFNGEVETLGRNCLSRCEFPGEIWHSTRGLRPSLTSETQSSDPYENEELVCFDCGELSDESSECEHHDNNVDSVDACGGLVDKQPNGVQSIQ